MPGATHCGEVRQIVDSPSDVSNCADIKVFTVARFEPEPARARVTTSLLNARRGDLNSQRGPLASFVFYLAMVMRNDASFAKAYEPQYDPYVSAPVPHVCGTFEFKWSATQFHSTTSDFAAWATCGGPRGMFSPHMLIGSSNVNR